MGAGSGILGANASMYDSRAHGLQCLGMWPHAAARGRGYLAKTSPLKVCCRSRVGLSKLLPRASDVQKKCREGLPLFAAKFGVADGRGLAKRESLFSLVVCKLKWRR